MLCLLVSVSSLLVTRMPEDRKYLYIWGDRDRSADLQRFQSFSRTVLHFILLATSCNLFTGFDIIKLFILLSISVTPSTIYTQHLGKGKAV